MWDNWISNNSMEGKWGISMKWRWGISRKGRQEEGAGSLMKSEYFLSGNTAGPGRGDSSNWSACSPWSQSLPTRHSPLKIIPHSGTAHYSIIPHSGIAQHTAVLSLTQVQHTTVLSLTQVQHTTILPFPQVQHTTALYLTQVQHTLQYYPSLRYSTLYIIIPHSGTAHYPSLR